MGYGDGIDVQGPVGRNGRDGPASGEVHVCCHTGVSWEDFCFLYSICCREDTAALASDDGFVLVTVDLITLAPLRLLRAHGAAITQVLLTGHHIVSLDKAGGLVAWPRAPAVVAGEEEVRAEWELAMGEGVLGMAVDLRRVALAKVAGLTVMDFWDAHRRHGCLLLDSNE